jgi:hypothetical protein
VVCIALASTAITHLVVTATRKRAPSSRFLVIAALVKDIQLGGLWLTLALSTSTWTVQVALSALALTHLAVTLSTYRERFAATDSPQHVGGGITTGAHDAANRDGVHAGVA